MAELASSVVYGDLKVINNLEVLEKLSVLGEALFSDLIVNGEISENGVILSAKYLGIESTALNSNKLGGLEPSQFLRSDTDGTVSGNLNLEGNLNMGNKNIIALNSIAFADYSETSGEGIRFPIQSGGQSSLWIDPNGIFKQDNHTIYHSGNLNALVKDSTGQSVGSNFTVKGRLLVGNTSQTTGDVIVYDRSNNPRIHLDGDSSGVESSSNTRIHLKGAAGDALFRGRVDVSEIHASTLGSIPSLSVTTINDISIKDYTRNRTIVDNSGYGVIQGLNAVAYGGNLEVSTGVAYTNSGLRVEVKNQTQVTMQGASTSGDRYDILYIRGSSASTAEGTFVCQPGPVGGSKEEAINQVPSDAVILAAILRERNQADIVTSDIDNNVRERSGIIGRKPLFLDSNHNVKARYEVHAKKFKEDGSDLNQIYATLSGGNTLNGTHRINGRTTITSPGGTLGGNHSSSNFALKIASDSDSILMDGNEILGTSALYIRPKSKLVLEPSEGNVEIISAHIKSDKTAATITIPSGSTEATWAHGYGNANYAVSFTTDSFERHIRWKDKAADSITIEIDDPASEDIKIDIILIGY